MKKDNVFLKEAVNILDDMRNIRRDIHQHPELGMHEHRTANLIAEQLERLNIEVKKGVGGTGVVGLLKGNNGNKTVALRADIDALPMQDLIDKNYVSKNPGIAHTCGHDGHTAIQLGAAMILSSVKDELPGNVKFIFQPSEDTLPGGALFMIKDGVLENPQVDAIFSLHLYPLFKEGIAVVKKNIVSISSLSFTLTIYGHGGHIGMPHKVLNPISLSALVITNTQTILPKNVEPGIPIIFDYGVIQAGTAPNIIPSEVVLKGNIRVSGSEMLDIILGKFENLIKGIVKSSGGDYDLKIQKSYPQIVNNPVLVDLWKKSAKKILDKNNVIEYDKIMTGGDDISYFHQRIPGVYWWLGIKNEKKGFVESLHSPKFDFNEDVMAIGAAIQAQAVWDFLHSE